MTRGKCMFSDFLRISSYLAKPSNFFLFASILSGQDRASLPVGLSVSMVTILSNRRESRKQMNMRRNPRKGLIPYKAIDLSEGEKGPILTHQCVEKKLFQGKKTCELTGETWRCTWRRKGQLTGF